MLRLFAVTGCARVLAGAIAFVFWGSLAVSARAEGLSPEEALRKFNTAAGFSMELVAAEPMIRQPVAMQFDRRGRMWVIQYLQYPNPAGLKAVKVDNYLRTIYDRVPEPPPKGPKGVDRITILEDTDGDGRADKTKDFISDLNLATGLAIGYGGVFVAQTPYLLFYPDRNRDDVPDGDPEVLLSGFGMEDSHAVLNSLQWGPDGWLYGAQGSTVTAHIGDLTFQQGIWRYHPVTKKFELFAEGGGNTWGVDFDRHGNIIAGTNYGQRAMLHQVQGAYYEKNFGKHGELQNPYAFGYFTHAPYKDFVGGHVTIGGIVYQADAYPYYLRNQYLAANVLSNAINWHRIEVDGSTFKNSHGDQLVTTDDQWFRPVDCTVGPDGQLYIADWYDQRANHVDPRDDWDKSNGRIYRLKYKGVPPAAPFDLDKTPTEALVKMLGHKNDWYVRQARQVLAERKPSEIWPALERDLRGIDEHRALESLWTLYVTGAWDEKLALQALGHGAADVRTWGVRFLGDDRTLTPDERDRLIALAASEQHPTVRSQLACTAKRLNASDGLPIVAAMLRHADDVKDPFIPLLLWWAIEDKATSDREAVLSLFTDPAAWQLPLARQAMIERLARRYCAAGTPADFDSAARLLSLAPSAQDAELVFAGMTEGLQGRRFESPPKQLAAPIAEVWSKGHHTLPLLKLALRVNYQPAHDLALARVADAGTPEKERLVLINLVGQVAGTECVPVLLGVVEQPKASGKVRKEALLALQRFNDPKIATALVKLYPALPADLRSVTRSLLCARAAGAQLLLAEVDGGRMDPKEIGTEELRQIVGLNVADLTRLVEKHWGKMGQATPDEKRAFIHGVKTSLKLAPGNPVAGKEVFTKVCATCHNLFGEGNKIGPELTGADRKNLDFLLTSLVDPSAVIRKDYLLYQALLNDGRSLSGLLVENTPATVTLLDAKNQRTTVDQADIDQLEPAPLSMMPEKLLDPLSAQQVRDLISYIQSAGPPGAAAAAAR
ncbi:MAG: c-type cytochrome [Planctomycetes bacterium]|nr:c-type cytochrome [Planctomycetota bacterium]